MRYLLISVNFRTFYILILLWITFAMNAYSANPEQCQSKVFSDLQDSQALPIIIGEASSDDNKFLYCEYHYSLQGNQRRVDYRDIEQRLIATKTVDFSISEWAPNILQDDFRHGEKVVVTRKDSTDTQSSKVFLAQYRRGVASDTTQDEDSEPVTLREKEFVLDDESVVVDAGFDNAIRDRWQIIMNGSTAQFLFLAPASLRTIQLNVDKHNEVTHCITGSVEYIPYNNSGYVCLMVKPSNKLLSWFVSSIRLLYDKDSQRLIYFSGASNVTTDRGKGQSVQITYRYY